jgi:uncharacterized RmlC-like cupin family protein
LARGEKAPRPDGAAVVSSVRDVAEKRIGHKEIGTGLSDLLPDGTRECERCGLPMMPVAEVNGQVTLECANRHRREVPLPSDASARERVRTWIMRRGAQLHVQHERWEAEEEAERQMEPSKARVIRRADRTRLTGQTAGMLREEAVRTDGLWVGVARTEPGRFSSWHHHGSYESVIYVLTGELQLECGPGGKTVLKARAGDCIFVPPGEIHREGNNGVEESEIVVMRSGSGDLVMNVAGPAA